MSTQPSAPSSPSPVRAEPVEARAQTPEPRAYKILTAPQWARWQADGTFTGAPIDLTDGYIHLSTADQVTETVDKHLAGQDGLVIARIDLSTLGDAVRWEPSRGGALFPHVYATLPLTVVAAHQGMARNADGGVVLP